MTNSGLITGNVTGGAGNDTIANALATGVINGNIDLGTGTDSISNLVGTGAVNKSGAGTLTLSGDNTGFTNAGTVLNITGGGTVSIGAGNNMFTGGIVFDNGTLATTGALRLRNLITLECGRGTVQAGTATTLSGVISGRRADKDRHVGPDPLGCEHLHRIHGRQCRQAHLVGWRRYCRHGAVVVTSPGSLKVNTAETIGSLAGSGNMLLNAGLTTGGDNTSTTYSGVISGAAA